jgi:hypothetical protein
MIKAGFRVYEQLLASVHPRKRGCDPNLR